ncbi:MAG: 5-formyltetrahydrofolate cyclo-ligase [Paracoccaceae bacterium]
MNDDADHGGGFASPPCFAHELKEGADGFAVVDRQTAIDVGRWRKARREELIAARLATPVAERERVAAEIGSALDAMIDFDAGPVIALYWPFKGELDLRGWMQAAIESGARIALPIVVAKAQPLIFREWTPESKLARGVWNIPVPADGAELAPDIVISPVVGFDPGCFRLGYGGGFYDRTLAAAAVRPKVIGVGLASAALPTIFPLPHDVPMDLILTGAGEVLTRKK